MTEIFSLVLARKATIEAIMENHFAFGCGLLNIDECRIGEFNRFPANLILEDKNIILNKFPEIKSAGRFPATQNTKTVFMSSKGKDLKPERNMDLGSTSKFFFNYGEQSFD